MGNDPRPIQPGDRVLVFDYRLFKDDVVTPLSLTMQPATVLRRYGYSVEDWSDVVYGDYGERYGEPKTWHYPDVLDVRFDHDGRESRAHFTDGVEVLQS